jgi:hypothetical protein
LPAFAARAQVPCAQEFEPLRAAVEKEGLGVKALVERRAPREQVCNQIKRFAVIEAKYVKFLKDNQSWCGIPPDAVKQVTVNHNHTLKLRGQACAAGPSPAQAGPPPGPGLSEALGTTRAPPPDTKTRRGTYDSLTGDPLQR